MSPLPTPRQLLPPQVRIRIRSHQETGKQRYHLARQSMACRCTRSGNQYGVSSKSTVTESDQVLKCQTGCWTLDPLAPLVPPQNLVQMFLDGTKEKKRGWCRSRSEKKPPPTVMLRTRHANIQATLRVVGESAVRSVATVQTATRSGDIVIDLVSLYVLLLLQFIVLTYPQFSIAPMRTVHIDAKSRRGTLGLIFNTGLFDADCPVLQVPSLSSFHEISVGLFSSPPVMVRWNYFQSWRPPVA